MADGWRHLQLILLLAPQLLLFWPGVLALIVGTALAVVSVLSPSGLAVGTLSWQPIFFAPILLILGASAALAGAVLAHHSSLTRPEAARRFSFVGRPQFPERCITTGLSLLIPGIVLEIVLFSIWLGTESSASQRLALAGIAQALIILGVVFMGFGLIYRMVGLRAGYRTHDGSVDILRFDPHSPETGSSDRVPDE
jgi:hypothetical protein